MYSIFLHYVYQIVCIIFTLETALDAGSVRQPLRAQCCGCILYSTSTLCCIKYNLYLLHGINTL